MKLLKAICVTLVTSLALTGCNIPMEAEPAIDPSAPVEFIQYDPITEGADVAVISTSLGTIKMVLFEKEAPNTVAHFKKLVNKGFYNDKPIILEGDTKALLTGSTDEVGLEGELDSSLKQKIDAEVTPSLWHFSGAVSAWCEAKNRFSKTMQSDSRFFIVGTMPPSTEIASQMEEYNYPAEVIDAYKEHGGMPQHTGSFTVFAQVYEGMEVVDEILKNTNGTQARSLEDVRIDSITLGKYKEVTDSE